MRSSILPPDRPKRAEPVAWRSLPASAGSLRGSQLEREIQNRVREAREAGFREAEGQAAAVFDTTARPLLERLAKTVTELTALRSEVLAHAKKDLLQLSLEIAARILHRELSINPAAIESLIQAALEKIEAREIHRVRVHPDQEGALRTLLEPLGRKVEVASDPTIESGGAVFELSRGLLDATIKTQLQEIARVLDEDE